MNKLKTESKPTTAPHLIWLYDRINYERQVRVTPRHFKLRNMREILRRLDNPHLNCPVIHVAGTKGKGSVATMLGSILSASGRKTGVYTSPHLETIHQRMAIDGNLISDAQLAETITALRPVVAAMDEESEDQGYRPLTFFEITTTAAFLFFATQNCDTVVLEVGLGGRLDSTNVCEPDACVITNISIDHTKQLGSTIDKIAFEKAGIIKPGVPVISGALHPDADEVIAEVATENEAPLFVLDRDFNVSSLDDLSSDSSSFACKGEIELNGLESAFKCDGLTLPVLGQHQQTNSALAIAAIQSLNLKSNWNINEEQIRIGLAKTSLSGRAEVVSQNPTVVVDMAHNVASIKALVSTLTNDLYSWKRAEKKTLIVAMTREKDFEGMLLPLLESFDEIVVTRYQDNPRGKCELELLSLATQIGDKFAKQGRAHAKVSAVSNPKDAWAKIWGNALENAKANEVICITGSAFLVAELRKTILGDVAKADLDS